MTTEDFINNKPEVEVAISTAPDNGDCFDEEIDCYYGQLTDSNLKAIQAPPVSLSIYVNGFHYVYKLESRYEADKETSQVPQLSQEETKDL